ncbi:hypothetical protein LLG96_17500 [bacterium]|nr:hypothetical protein [bacterium]
MKTTGTKVITFILAAFSLFMMNSNITVCNDSRSGCPVIRKLGTIDCDMVETTPVVFRDKLYRFEYVRSNYKPNITGNTYSRFIDTASGKPTPAFAQGFDLGNAYVENDTVYVSCVNDWGGSEIWLFRSGNLEGWDSWKALELEGWKIYNTSLCKGAGAYIMAIEVGQPPDVVGRAFTMRFLTSPDLVHWKLTPDECVYTKDRYSACPALHYLDGMYYMIYLEEKPVPPGTGKDWPAYAPHIVRSNDLAHWESSPCNPIMSHSPEDKRIANPKLTKEERSRIVTALDLNNSDVECCEFRGKTIITYSWGDQHGTEFLAEAVYEGTLASFLKGFFPQKSR